ncbi:CBS domain-containing protein [Ornithinibacillus sp. L9]|uniref:CBS domain-containing protein n=1 Tax=Ornithinibacillus caprae TaxID=2678566 RepID=A0A6N8FPN5_9BACI|nr:CBS domain-containing protein [Ornithinibacillus caprae]MUK90644.1 CBS domain-containing protein [Ornithinibacillus caprae]
MKIRDFMITDVISVTESTTIKELLKILVANKIGGVPVVGDNGDLIGVISDGDVIRYVKPQGRTVYDMFSLVLVAEQEDFQDKLTYCLDFQVSKIMRTKDIITVNESQRLEEALNIFSKHRIKKIPVIDENKKLIGVVSRGDILRYVYNQIINKTP